MFRLGKLEETNCIGFLYTLWPSESFFLFFTKSSGNGKVLSCSTFMVNLMFGCMLFRCYRILCSTYKLIYYIYISNGFKMCIKSVAPLVYVTKLQNYIPLTVDCLFSHYTKDTCSKACACTLAITRARSNPTATSSMWSQNVQSSNK
jgi:hypothetical protein